MRKKFIIAVILFYVTSLPLFAEMVTLNFESGSAPGYTPVQSTQITDQFKDSHGVIFSGDFSYLSQVGENASSWWAFGSSAGIDTLKSGQPDIGQYFLGEVYKSSLRMDFTDPVKSVSGLLFDVDGEVITFTAKNALDQTIATTVINSSSPNSGDGLATFWEISSSDYDIASIDVTLSGGLGIDNITIDRNIPEPNIVLLLLTGIFVFIATKNPIRR